MSDTNDINQDYHQSVQQLLALPNRKLPLWISEHKSIHSLAFLQFLKNNYLTATQIQKFRENADALTKAAILIAKQMAENDEAKAVAQWMHGLWATYYDEKKAITSFKSALRFYKKQGDWLSVGRLYANLVGVYADCGRNYDAEKAYAKAYNILSEFQEQYPTYFVYLIQNYGWLSHSWGRYTDALDAHERALDVATRYELKEDIPDILSNRSRTLAYLGRVQEAEASFIEARIQAESVKQYFTLARIDMNLGELYTSFGKPADAARQFRLAEENFGKEMEQGYLHLAQATLYRQLGAAKAALTHYELALPILEKDQLLSLLTETQLNLAICLRLFGQVKYKKRDLQRRVSALLSAARSHWEAVRNEYWLIQVYFEEINAAQSDMQIEQALSLVATPPLQLSNPLLIAEFEYLKAETYRLAGAPKQDPLQTEEDYRAALDYGVKEGLHWLRRKSLIGLGKLYLQKDWREARRLFEEAAQIDDQLRQTLSLAELKASVHVQSEELFDDLIKIAFEKGDFGLLLLYVWRAKASVFLELATTMQDEAQYTDDQRQAIDGLRQQIAGLRWRLAEKNSSDARYEATNPELNALLDQLLHLRCQAHHQNVAISTLNLPQMHNLLKKMDSDLLLEYVRCGEFVYGICATKTGVGATIQLVHVDTIVEVAGHLELAFHSFNAIPLSERTESSEERRSECERYLRQCFELLVAPLLEHVSDTQGTKKILIAPCDSISTLPFAAFWNGLNYFIESYEIELIQSGALLLLESPTASEFSASVTIASSTGNAIAVRDEAVEVAKTISPCTTFVDTPVVGYLRSLNLPPRILHISAHTLQRDDAPIFTAMQLSGEVLSVEQTYELHLAGTELVTLSGCLTAGGMTSDASLFAFQSAFLLAGAKRILCTLWPIAADLPKPMMVHLYSLVEQGVPIPSALRQTQLYFMRESAYSLPAYWSAFTCIRR